MTAETSERLSSSPENVLLEQRCSSNVFNEFNPGEFVVGMGKLCVPRATVKESAGM
jgi:hypothetical protein